MTTLTKFSKASVSFVSTLVAVFAISVGALAQIGAYSNRPSIMSIPAAELNYQLKQSQVGSQWNEIRQAHYESVAYLLEVYKGKTILFLARDSELLYDTAVLAKADLNQVHLVNVSRANMNDVNLKSYLAQFGLTQSALNNGKEFVFIDTGFAGSIPNKIKTLFAQSTQKRIHAHLIVSQTPNYPSMRTFLSHLNENAAYSTSPSQFHSFIVNYEHMPRYMHRSSSFEYINGSYEAYCPQSAQSDGQVNPTAARAFMADLRAGFNPYSFQHQRAFVRDVIEAVSAESGSHSKLAAVFNSNELMVTSIIKDLYESQNIHDIDFKWAQPDLFGTNGRVHAKWKQAPKATPNLYADFAAFKQIHFSVGQTVTINHKPYTVTQIGKSDDENVHYNLEENAYTGKTFLLRIDNGADAENLSSFAKEGVRLARLTQVGIQHAKVTAYGTNFVLKEIPNGQRGDLWLKQNPLGTPGWAAGATALRNMFASMVSNGTYFGELSPKNMYWDGKNWTIFKVGGSETNLDFNSALKRFEAKFEKRWGFSFTKLNLNAQNYTTSCKVVFGN